MIWGLYTSTLVNRRQMQRRICGIQNHYCCFAVFNNSSLREIKVKAIDTFYIGKNTIEIE
jgi:hypothetical protein